jgi:hypothetical protein
MARIILNVDDGHQLVGMVHARPTTALEASVSKLFAGTPWHKHVPARIEAVGG